MGFFAACAIVGAILGGWGAIALSRRIGSTAFWKIWVVCALIVIGLSAVWSYVIGDAVASELLGLGAIVISTGVPALLSAGLGGMIGGHRHDLEQGQER